jgi:general secretion pathway protein F
MPVYRYKGVSNKGKAVSGLLDADNVKSLKETLRQQGVFLSEYKQDKAESLASEGTRRGFKIFAGRVNPREVSEVTRQMAVLLRASIPAVDTLAAVARQVENQNLQRVLNEVRRAVTEGASMAAAMSQHPKVFSDLYVNMVRAGESSGTLDLVFERLADFMENQVALKSKLTGTMTYPLIMITLGIGIVSLLMVFVIPRMTAVFSEMGAQLPFATRVLINVSDFMRTYWWLVLAGGVGGVLLFNRWKNGTGKRTWHTFLLRAPVFGSLVQMVAVARFAKTLGTLLSSGVPIIAALGIVRHVLGNVILDEQVANAMEAVKEGSSLAEPLRKSGGFPPMVTHMISVGEESGELEQMLENVSRAYEVQVNAKITVLTALLEPIMIVLMGVVIGFIVFAVLMPMLQMNEVLTK